MLPQLKYLSPYSNLLFVGEGGRDIFSLLSEYVKKYKIMLTIVPMLYIPDLQNRSILCNRYFVPFDYHLYISPTFQPLACLFMPSLFHF